MAAGGLRDKGHTLRVSFKTNQYQRNSWESSLLKFEEGFRLEPSFSRSGEGRVWGRGGSLNFGPSGHAFQEKHHQNRASGSGDAVALRGRLQHVGLVRNGLSVILVSRPAGGFVRSG